MRFVIPFMILAGLGVSSIAVAEVPARDGKADAPARAISDGDLKVKIDQLGYDVRRLEAKDRHYEAHLVDRGSGGAVEATFDKSSGELVSAKLARDDREARKPEETHERREMRRHEGAHEREQVNEHRDSRPGERRDSND
jgi:hypothetical protein